jgi:hypothetical protein
MVAAVAGAARILLGACRWIYTIAAKQIGSAAAADFHCARNLPTSIVLFLTHPVRAQSLTISQFAAGRPIRNSAIDSMGLLVAEIPTLTGDSAHIASSLANDNARWAPRLLPAHACSFRLRRITRANQCTYGRIIEKPGSKAATDAA